MGYDVTCSGSETATVNLRMKDCGRSVLRLMGNGRLQYCGSPVHVETLVKAFLTMVRFCLSRKPFEFFSALRTLNWTMEPSGDVDHLGEMIRSCGRLLRKDQGGRRFS